MATDTEVILNALQKERNELHDKIMQVDRIIKRVKSLEYTNDSSNHKPAEIKVNGNKVIEQPVNILPKTTDIKIQLLRIFDLLRIASKLKDIQDEYNKLSGNKYNIRESIRSLQNAGLVKTIKIKTSNRGHLWAKAEWIENGQLVDKHKPDGFDLLYHPDILIYQ